MLRRISIELRMFLISCAVGTSVSQFLNLYQAFVFKSGLILTSAGDLTLTSRKRNSSKFLTSFDASMCPPSLRCVLFVSTSLCSAVFFCSSSSVKMTTEFSFDLSSSVPVTTPRWTVIDSSIFGTLCRSPIFFSWL